VTLNFIGNNKMADEEICEVGSKTEPLGSGSDIDVWFQILVTMITLVHLAALVALVISTMVTFLPSLSGLP
jgi:hypothetical protein